MGDTTQTEDATVCGFSILPKLNMGPNSSPLDGVILKVLRAKWDLNELKLWTQGEARVKIMKLLPRHFPDQRGGGDFTKYLHPEQ